MIGKAIKKSYRDLAKKYHPDKCSGLVDGLETDEEDPNHQVFQAAHRSLESLEPGYLHSKASVVFVRGYGFCDGKRREEVRSKAAKSYTAAARAQQAS